MLSAVPALHLFILTLLSFVLYSNALKGAVPLDSWTFDKVLEKFDAALIKFDVSYPYGEKEDEYGKVSDAVKNTPNLIVGEVGVQDYGDKENSDLSDRFGIKKEDFPSLRLFVKGRKEPYAFKGDFKVDNIKTFIMDHSSVRLVLDKCLPAFDNFALKFMESADAKAKKIIIEEASKLSSSLTSKEEKKSAEVYLKVMGKVLEKGRSFVGSERERLANMIQKGKITEAKREELQARINIIQSFIFSKNYRKEEL